MLRVGVFGDGLQRLSARVFRRIRGRVGVFGLVLGLARLEECAVAEHGAGDAEEAVADDAQCLSVGLSPSSGAVVLGAGFGVSPHGDSGPVVDGVGESVVPGPALADGLPVAGPDGDGGYSGEASQGCVVALAYGLFGFGQEGGE